jgi:molybdate transport system substrate-binding protein
MVLIFACLALVASAPGATDIHVVSSGGFAAALKALAPGYEQATGDKLVLGWGPSTGETHDAIPARLARGKDIPANVGGFRDHGDDEEGTGSKD